MHAAPAPRAVLFDAYGTLFDVYSVAHAAEQMFPGRGDALALLWRDKQIEYTRLLTMAGRYRSFWDLTVASLRYAAQRHGLTLDAAAEARLLNQYRHLSAFPENRPVLEAHGWGALQEELHGLTKQGRWGELGDRITDEMLDTLAIVGMPEEIPAKLAVRYGGIAQRLSLVSYAGIERTARERWMAMLAAIRAQ